MSCRRDSHGGVGLARVGVIGPVPCKPRPVQQSKELHNRDKHLPALKLPGHELMTSAAKIAISRTYCTTQAGV
eukprot:1852541-Heterocapsa_arctica.AAC.1